MFVNIYYAKLLKKPLHTHAYQYIIESLGMDEAEVFNMYRELPSVAAKANWALPFTQSLGDTTFQTGTLENDQKIIKRLNCFLCGF